MLLDPERRRSRRAPKARSAPRELGERGNQNCAIRPGLRWGACLAVLLAARG